MQGWIIWNDGSGRKHGIWRTGSSIFFFFFLFLSFVFFVNYVRRGRTKTSDEYIRERDLGGGGTQLPYAPQPLPTFSFLFRETPIPVLSCTVHPSHAPSTYSRKIPTYLFHFVRAQHQGEKKEKNLRIRVPPRSSKTEFHSTLFFFFPSLCLLYT